MKNSTIKVWSIVLAALISLGGVGTAVFALKGSESEESAAQQESAVVEATDAAAGPTKDETVYVLAGADGAVKKIIVGDWLQNPLGSDSLDDVSELSDIENVKNDASFTGKDGGAKVWDAEKNDVYYRGSIEKELPVSLSVSYKLDSKSVTPDEIKGKSGRVTIRFDYMNNEYKTVEINGKEEKIYVPFAMLTGLMLDNEVFKNVEVSNGKLISDGARTIVAGIAFPGLQESLGIDRDAFEIPDFVEISADTEDFRLGMTVTLATNELFNEIDVDKLEGVDDLTSKLDEMTEAMTKLTDGSSELYDGLCTLLDKSNELVSGIDKLADGAKQLRDGAAKVDGGAAQLQDGAAQLKAGLDTLASNNDAINGGAKQVFDTLLSTAQTQLANAGLEVQEMTVDNYADVLNGVITSLDDTAVYESALNTVTEAVEAKRGYITDQVTAAVRTEVESKVVAAVRPEVEAKVTAAARETVSAQVESAVREQVRAKVTEAVKAEVEAKVTAAVRESVEENVIKAATGMDKAAYEGAVAAGMIDEAAKAQIAAATDAQMQSDEVRALISQNVDEQMDSEQVKLTIETQTEAQMSSDAVKQTVEENTDAQMGSETVTSLISKNTDEQMESNEVKTIVAAKVDEKMASDEIAAIIAQNTETQVKKAIAEAMAGDEVQSKLSAASEGAREVIALKASLDGYNAFYLGLMSYTDGVAQAASGAGELKAGADSLKSGTGELSDGADELYDGILTLKNGIPSLVDGVTQLRDGAMQLSDGLKKFDEEGVQKIVEAFDGNVSGLIERVKAISSVSKEYRSFSGISDGMDGKVKFIFKTDEIGE